MSILGLLEPVRLGARFHLDQSRRHKAHPAFGAEDVVLLLVTLWAASAVSDFFDRRVRLAADLTPSIQVLIGKVTRWALIGLAIMIVLSAVGIDISALALFSGAVGVGIGFGLQKIVSNLVSGIILLADKSIKPGDVISVGDSFGWVITMGARYTSVSTRDGREVLIPNEDLVTQRVVNWSYSKNDIRLDVNFSIDVAGDPHKAQRLALEAVAAVPRVLKDSAAGLPFHEHVVAVDGFFAALLDQRSDRGLDQCEERGAARAVGYLPARRHRIPLAGAGHALARPGAGAACGLFGELIAGGEVFAGLEFFSIDPLAASPGVFSQNAMTSMLKPLLPAPATLLLSFFCFSLVCWQVSEAAKTRKLAHGRSYSSGRSSGHSG